MNSTDKGDRLEEAFFQYLLGQKDRGELVLGAYPPDNCKIFKKKEYYCKDREANVEFDVVLEFYANGRISPHLYVIFECKNYIGGVPELYVNDFSSKLGRIFAHTAKGVMVVASRLQSGAEKIARSKGMGIVKYDEHGLDIIADRKARPYIENRFVEFQIFKGQSAAKSLKFSAYNDGKFFSSVGQFLGSLHPELAGPADETPTAIPFMPPEAIKGSVRDVLKLIDYRGGSVDLERICAALSIDLQYSDEEVHDADGSPILGSAHFHRKVISINANGNRNRERFTLGHEIGHFCLKHQRYLSSENIIERDLLINKETDANFNLERLEYQANSFSSNLILPDEIFKLKTAQLRDFLEIRDRGHGYIFVDDQPCNYTVYDQLLTALSTHFEVSKQAIQIKFKHLGMLNDQRKRNQPSPIATMLEGLISPRSA